MLPPPGITPTASSAAVSTIPVPDIVLLAGSAISSLLSSTTATPTAAMPSTSPSSTLLSIATAAAATAVAAAASSKAPSDDDDDNNGECRLLGPFALFIQGSLGLLAILSLVWKRYRERPQRPVKIWFFDVSKQYLGSVLVHMANLLMSMLSAGQLTVHPSTATAADEHYHPNPCSFYLLNLAIDTTIGIPILIVLLRLLTRLFLLTPVGVPPQSIQSGNYGSPPKTRWWIKQCLIYFLGQLGMKVCVLFIFAVLPWISRVGDWALKWTEGNEVLQVGFVMLLFPCIMNAMQYWIIDSFIKDQTPSGHEAVAQDDDDDDGEGGGDGAEEGCVAEEEDSDDDASDEIGEETALTKGDDVKEPKVTTTAKKVTTTKAKTTGSGNTRTRTTRLPSELIISGHGREYDSTTDGEASPTVVGSGSGSGSGSSAVVKTPVGDADEVKQDGH